MTTISRAFVIRVEDAGSRGFSSPPRNPEQVDDTDDGHDDAGEQPTSPPPHRHDQDGYAITGDEYGNDGADL